MFQISLDNYQCKIRITSTYATDFGLVYTSNTSTFDYGLIGDENLDYLDYGLLTDANVSTITGLVISRREVGDTDWAQIYSKSLSSTADLTYVYYDKYTRSRRSYEYKFDVYNGTSIVYTATYEIECNFDSIYISDASGEYILSLNLDFDSDSNQKISYQEPLQSEFPIRIQNGLSHYDTGYVEGLPLPLDSYGRPTATGSYKYKQLYISYLKNGLNKFIKTYRGDAVLASVNAGVKLNKHDFEGAEPVKFTWTQIGRTPLHD